MRPVELLVIVLVAGTIVGWAAPDSVRVKWLRASLAVLAAVLGMHLLVEGYRWPMVPAYVLAAMIGGASVWMLVRARRRGGERRRQKAWRVAVVGMLALLVFAVSATAPTLFPHLRLPEPTGPYAIGTVTLSLIDRQRPETFTPDAGDHRTVVARVWYPADAAAPAGATPVPYAENAAEVSRALTRFTRFPSFLFSHLGRVETHSYRDLPMPSGGRRFPIVVFNHGYWATVSQSTSLMEELASRGYVAVSVGHAFESPYALLPDGGVEVFDPHNAEFAARGRERTEALDIERQLTMTRDVGRLERLFREVSRRRPKMVESLHIWVADISTVLDELERRNLAAGLFEGRLDTTRVAVMGHSFGGAAAGQACLDEPRCRAGVNFDGLQLGDLLDRPLEVPFLFFHHDNAGARNRAVNLPVFERARGPAYMAILNGTGHMSFSDICLYPRTSLFRLASPGGAIDGRRCQSVINALVLSFLDRYLRENDSANPEAAAGALPEVEMTVRNRG